MISQKVRDCVGVHMCLSYNKVLAVEIEDVPHIYPETKTHCRLIFTGYTVILINFCTILLICLQ